MLIALISVIELSSTSTARLAGFQPGAVAGRTRRRRHVVLDVLRVESESVSVAPLEVGITPSKRFFFRRVPFSCAA